MSKVKRNQCLVCGGTARLVFFGLLSASTPSSLRSVYVSVGVWYVRSMRYKRACVPSRIRKGRCSVWVFGETYGVGDEREKWDILMSGFQYIYSRRVADCL